jgi:hypothetical protein
MRQLQKAEVLATDEVLRSESAIATMVCNLKRITNVLGAAKLTE